MESRAYIPHEVSRQAYQSYLRPVPTAEELEQSGITDISQRYEQKNEILSGRKVIQYDIDFDRQQAREVHKHMNEQDYEAKLANFRSYMDFQLVTALGERFNRGLSRYSYRSVDGVLLGEHSDEPVLEIFERGRAYRESNGNPIDHDRERAEVTGFAKIQEYMKSAPIGATMISVSQPGGGGSIYKHNFYDGFKKKEDGNIEVVRFSNANNVESTIEKLKEIDPSIDIHDNLSPEYLLANPIIISGEGEKFSLDDIHKKIHKDHDVMSESKFEIVVETSRAARRYFINSVIDDPNNVNEHNLLFNAHINIADHAAMNTEDVDILEMYLSAEMSRDEIYHIGHQPVRAVDTGCGYSGGMEVAASGNGSFSVTSFSGEVRLNSGIEDKYGSLEFPCPNILCLKKNTRPYGKLIKKCGEGQTGGCGKDVSC
jgi:hypothetical protein